MEFELLSSFLSNYKMIQKFMKQTSDKSLLEIYVHLCGIVLVTAIEYQLSCPDKLQRHLRGQNCTARGTHYLCLFNILENINMENCASEDFKAQPGFRKIRKPGITNGNCTVDRYQPIIFSTYEFSDCMYTKSSCEEKGQVVVSYRKGNQDRTCRCDYRTGYSYIIPPRNLCACVPSEEDCSCMRKYCGRNETLSADYKCVPDGKLTLTACSKISFPLPPGTTSPPPGTTSPPPGITSLQQEQFSTFTDSSGVIASAAVVLILLFVIVVVILINLRVAPELISYKIVCDDEASKEINRDEKTQTYTVIQGCKVKVFFTYKSLLPCGEIIKNDTTGRMLEGVKGKEKVIKCNNKPFRLMMAVKRRSSFYIPCLTKEHTGRYEILLKNKIYLPHTLIERWKRFHTSLMNFIYKIDDDKENSSSFFEFIIAPLPEEDEAVDVLYGKKIELKIGCANDKSEDHADDQFGRSSENMDSMSSHVANVQKVVWFKSDGDQFKVIESEKREDQGEIKYLSGDKYNESLIINKTCMKDAGRYVCFVVLDPGEISSYGWELRVIPQESSYKELEQHRLDKDFVPVSVLSNATTSLKENGVVILKGREGTGKTKMSLELSSSLKVKGYLPVMVESEEDVSVEFDESNILYIFDQSSDWPDYWYVHLKRFVSSITTKRLSCKAVFTSRRIDYPDLKNCRFMEEITVDLDKTLTDNEKKDILTVYMKKNNIEVVPSKESNFKLIEIINDETKTIKLDDDSIKMIIHTEPLQGFPFMAKKFCEARPYLHLGEKYFQYPPMDVIQEIKKVVAEGSKDTASLREILRLVILVYITLSDDQNLNTSNFKYETVSQIQRTLCRNCTHTLPPTAYDKIKEDIKVAANSLVGDYLTCSDDVYEFIHPYYHKAVMLSSDYFADYVIQKNRVELILECIRGKHYIQKEGESVLKIERKSFHVLCERLVREFAQYLASCKRGKASDIGKYIYQHWVTSYDSDFCRQLFGHLEGLMYAKKNDEKEKVQVKIKPWQVLLLIKHLTCNWNDLQICSSDDIHDIVLIFGLLSLCQLTPPTKTKQEELENVEDTTFGRAIETLCKRLSVMKGSEGKRFSITKDDELGSKLGASLDQHGNTFFHYLVLFNEDIACRVLECCCKHVKQEWTVTNKLDFRPIDIAVALGKPKLCKVFIQAYKDIKFKITKDDWMKKNRKRLRSIWADTRNYLLGKKTESTEKEFDIFENFDSEIGRSIVTGDKEDYKELKNILH